MLGTGAAFVRVQRGVRGGVVRHLGLVESLQHVSAERLRGIAGKAPRHVVLVLPSGATATRQVSFGLAAFRDGLPELKRSAGELFPLPAHDVELGYLRRVAPDTGDDAGGYLLAAQRSRVEPIVEQLRSAFGDPSITVLSTAMAMLGLGLQHQPAACVAEHGPIGPAHHHLRFGQVVELDGEPGDAKPDAVLPDAQSERSAQAFALAAAGALVLDVAARDIVPFRGALPRQARQWLAPAACSAAAAALLLAAPMILEVRHERAIAQIEERRRAVVTDIEGAQQARRDLERYVALIDQAQVLSAAGASHVLEDLVAAHAAVPRSAFVEQITIQPNGIVVCGAADRAGDVLASIEASPLFDAARNVNPPAALGPSLDHKEEFEIAAMRVVAALPAPASRTSEVP